MQTRRDQVQAYHFATSRLAAALATSDVGSGQAAFRRADLGVFLGTGIAALICVAALVIGLIDPGAGAAWRQNGAIVVAKETGTRFVYLGGKLHPVANYASALLIAGSSAAVNYLPARALAPVPVGGAIGIPGAPDTLPAPSALLPGIWAVCLPAAHRGAMTLDFAPPARAAPVGGQRALVATPAGAQFVIWDNVKYPVASRAALVALGLGNSAPVLAPDRWLAALRTGPALAPPSLPGAGKRGPGVAGHSYDVGQLFDSDSGGVDQYYVLLADGLAPISHIEFALFAASGPKQAPAVPVSPAQIAAAPASRDSAMLGALPDLLSGPVFTLTHGALCVRQKSPGAAGDTTVVTEDVDQPGVILPPGTGLIASGPPGPGGALASTAQPYLIAGTGQKYALIGNAAQDLGYGGTATDVMPAAVLDLVPSGPPLSAAAAQRPVPPAPGGQ